MWVSLPSRAASRRAQDGASRIAWKPTSDSTAARSTSRMTRALIVRAVPRASRAGGAVLKPRLRERQPGVRIDQGLTLSLEWNPDETGAGEGRLVVGRRLHRVGGEPAPRARGPSGRGRVLGVVETAASARTFAGRRLIHRRLCREASRQIV